MNHLIEKKTVIKAIEELNQGLEKHLKNNRKRYNEMGFL